MENRMFLFSSWKVHIIDMIMKACMKALEQKKPSLVLKRELDGGVKRVDLKGWVGSKGTRVVVPSGVQGPHQPAKSPSSKQLQHTATCFSRTVPPTLLAQTFLRCALAYSIPSHLFTECHLSLV